MRSIALMLGVFLLAGFTGLGDTTSVDVAFTPDEHLLTGTQLVSWETPPEVAWFSLPANLGREPNPHIAGYLEDQSYPRGFDPSWTKIDGVWWVSGDEERPLDYELLAAPPTVQTYSLEDVLLRIELPEGPGALKIAFRSRFPHIWYAEPGRVGTIYTWRFGWHPLPTPSVENSYLPQVMLAHDYRVRLEVPAGWSAALPGDVTRTDEAEQVVYEAGFGERVRSVALFIAPEDQLTVVRLQGRTLNVELVALPGHEDKVRAMATYVWEILEYFEERYGPYPFERLLLVEHPTDRGMAFAADGVAFMPSWLFRRSDLTAPGTLSRLGQFVLAHEIAHQWWGIGVGVDLDAENWLSEGFAQYAAMRWFEDRYGAQEGNVFRPERPGLGEALLDNALGFFNLREHMVELPYVDTVFMGFDEPLVKPTSEVEYLQASAVRLYEKGALVLRALAHVIGEDVLDATLREAHDRYRGAWLTVEGFHSLVQEVSGHDVDQFFEDWVWGDGQADYAVTGMDRKHDGDRHVTHVHLKRTGSGFLPVPVVVIGADDERATRTWASQDDDRMTMVFETDFAVRRVVIDPEHRVPDIRRLNNHWPRKYEVAMDRSKLPLDAYLIQADPATQALSLRYLNEFGWEIVPQFQAVSGWVRYGRDYSISGRAQITDTLVGQLSLTRHLWSTPHIGSPATYWMPAGQLSVTVARTPRWVTQLALSWQEVVRHVQLGAASLLVDPAAQAGRISLAMLVEERVFPRTYIQLTAQGGLSSETLPREFQFRLGTFNTLGAPPITPPSPVGQYKVSGTLSLWLPDQRPDYLLGGAALLSEVIPRLYLSAGRVWSDPSEWVTMPTYVEAGGELWTTMEALGGLLRFRVVVGLVWPISPAGPGMMYFGLDM